MRPLFAEVLPTHQRAGSKLLSLANKEQQRRRKRIGSIEEFKEAYPELTFIIDGVEQEKRKPKDKEKRKSDYSKKKSRHTRKQIVISTPLGIIISQSKPVGGRIHDFKAFKEDQSVQEVCRDFVEHRVKLYADSGSQGIADLNLPLEASLIQRARRNHPLTRDEKKLNRLRSSTRIRVEHILSRRKKYAIASAVYRNRDEDYDATMNVVSGLRHAQPRRGAARPRGRRGRTGRRDGAACGRPRLVRVDGPVAPGARYEDTYAPQAVFPLLLETYRRLLGRAESVPQPRHGHLTPARVFGESIS